MHTCLVFLKALLWKSYKRKRIQDCESSVISLSRMIKTYNKGSLGLFPDTTETAHTQCVRTLSHTGEISIQLSRQGDWATEASGLTRSSLRVCVSGLIPAYTKGCCAGVGWWVAWNDFSSVSFPSFQPTPSPREHCTDCPRVCTHPSPASQYLHAHIYRTVPAMLFRITLLPQIGLCWGTMQSVM